MDCIYCTNPIQQHEIMYADGIALQGHRECGLRSAVGGIGHLENHEYWCKIHHDPDGGLTYRDSALLVWQWVEENGIDAALAIR